MSLANCLRVLDYFAHGGSEPGSLGFSGFPKAESIRMYNEVAAKLDSVHKRPAAGDPPLHIVIDDAFVDAKQ